MRFLRILILLILVQASAQAQVNTVKTENGLVAGERQDDIAVFKGIPFAAPPVGDLRWKAPQPAADWKGVKQCTNFSASPIQPKPVPFYCWSEEFIAPPEPLSEDCLYLNIWTGARSSKEKRPVFVWIYGGGFSSGSAACAIYDGAEMARQGIVFVSLNYRVGPFGFMAHPELSKEQNQASGNYGILDQVAALRWIQQNISAFGGDPKRVTIAGQSAGSISIYSLIASPLAKGLFHGAIAQSGGMYDSERMASLAVSEQSGIALQKQAGASDLAALRKKSAEEILAASQAKDMPRFGLTADGYVLPKDLKKSLQAGQFNQVPVLAGWVTGDGALFGNAQITAEKFAADAKEKYGDMANDFLQVFPASSDEAARNNTTKLTLLGFAAYPAHRLAGYNSKATYMYEVTHVPTDKPGFPNYGAFHTSEVPYALHTLHTWKRSWQQHDLDVEKLMSGYWIQFVKTGNPNSKGLPDWKAYSKNDGVILQIDAKTEAKPALLKPEFDLMDRLDARK